ncbi:mCG148164 [Mus musculus]|nr:mCG148164 [Mus musculus]
MWIIPSLYQGGGTVDTERSSWAPTEGPKETALVRRLCEVLPISPYHRGRRRDPQKNMPEVKFLIFLVKGGFLVSSPVAVIKYSDRHNLSEKWFILALSSRVQPTGWRDGSVV